MARYQGSNFTASLLRNIQDALGTDEEGEALVEVARNAHKAEQELAAMIRKQKVKPTTTFTVGQKVKILDDRRCHWQPSEEMTIAAIEPSNEWTCEVLIMDDGRVYASYWFDPTQPVLKYLDKVKDSE